MDFNFKKLANDASGFFSRAKQLTEETFLKAEKTELDAHFENLLQRADKTEEHTKKLLSCLESYLQPNPTLRMEDVFYEKLELKKDAERTNNLEHLGQAMLEAGNEFGPSTAYGSALLKVAQTEFKLGASERELISNSAANTLLPIRRFLEGDMKTIQKERKILQGKRLDLDACKSRLKKAKTLESQANAEADLRVAQAEFDKQVEITKLLLEGIQTAHNNQLKHLRDFVEAQLSFYAQAHQDMADLQRELSGNSCVSATMGYQANGRGGRGNGLDLFGSADESGGELLDVEQSTLRISSLPNMVTKQARAIMDYEPLNANELAVRQNEVLIIYRLPELDADYVMAEQNGKRGRVPVSYLEII